MRNWRDVLPSSVARKQEIYERASLASRMRRAGLSFSEISQRFGVCPERARQLVLKANTRKVSPVEIYFNRSPEVFKMSQKMSRVRGLQ